MKIRPVEGVVRGRKVDLLDDPARAFPDVVEVVETAVATRPWNPSRRRGLLVRTGGVVLVALGAYVLGAQSVGLFNQGQADRSERGKWDQAVSLPAPLSASPSAPVLAPKPVSAALGGNDYALVSFPAQHGMAVVAGDGDWSALKTRAAVHWHASPGPGQPGNGIIAFHREPSMKDADQVRGGDQIIVQDRSGKNFRYKVAFVRTVYPGETALLAPVNDGGSWVTLVTCTPFYVDVQRILIRAKLEA